MGQHRNVREGDGGLPDSQGGSAEGAKGYRARKILNDPDGRSPLYRWAWMILPALGYICAQRLIRPWLASARTQWLYLAALVLLLTVFLVLYRRQYGEEVSGREGKPDTAGILMCLGLAAAGFILTRIFRDRLPKVPIGEIAGIAICLVVPCCEEMVYRGLVYEGAKEYLGETWALVLSTLLFAAAHGSLLQAAFALPAGLALGLIRRRDGSLRGPIVTHVLVNSAAMLAYLI